jgi:opacity protein-like surface antigen
MTLMNVGINIFITKFGFAPVFGVLYQLSDQMDFNANLRYNMIFTDETSTTTLGLNHDLYCV